jgi:hypothetical protein
MNNIPSIVFEIQRTKMQFNNFVNAGYTIDATATGIAISKDDFIFCIDVDYTLSKIDQRFKQAMKELCI